MRFSPGVLRECDPEIIETGNEKLIPPSSPTTLGNSGINTNFRRLADRDKMREEEAWTCGHGLLEAKRGDGGGDLTAKLHLRKRHREFTFRRCESLLS
jgi:hypothetical protein